MICPWRFTENFNRKIRSMFYVPNFSRTMDLIKRQFLSGQAVNVGGDSWRIQIKDIPAIVVVDAGTLVTINYSGE